MHSLWPLKGWKCQKTCQYKTCKYKTSNSFQNFDHVDPPKYSDTKVDFLPLDSSGTMEKNQAWNVNFLGFSFEKCNRTICLKVIHVTNEWIDSFMNNLGK